MSFSSRTALQLTKRSQVAEAGGFNQDPDVSKLHDQIDSIEENIMNFKSEIKQKTAAYESEVLNLEAGLKKKEIDKETKMSALREKNAREVLDCDMKSAGEANELRMQIDNFKNRRSQYSKKHNEALRVRKEAEVEDLRRQIEQIKNKNLERDFEATTKNQGNKMERKGRIIELRAQIELIDGEINDITSRRQEELQATSLKIQQTSFAFEQRCREQKEQLDMYRNQLVRRQAQLDDLIKIGERQVQEEIQQIENDINSVIERRGKLHQTLERYRKRIAKEERVIQEDIGALKETIDAAIKTEEELLQETKEGICKLQEASCQTAMLNQTIDSIHTEIEQIKSDNSDMRGERTRLDTSMYNSRLSRFNSSK